MSHAEVLAFAARGMSKVAYHTRDIARRNTNEERPCSSFFRFPGKKAGMPRPTGPRHPLFHRLRKPLTPYTSMPFIELTMDDEDDPEGSEIGVYLATRYSKQLQQWAADIKRRHKADTTHKTDDGISGLSLDPLRREELRQVGRWKPELIGQLGISVTTVQGEQTACVSHTYVVLAVRRATNEAVGFVSFAVDWKMDSHGHDTVELELEPDQAWIDPAFRRRRRGELMAFAISEVVGHQFTELENTTRWKPGFDTKVDVCVVADIYSKSGEAMLNKCADALEMQINWRLDLTQMEVVRFLCRPLW